LLSQLNSCCQQSESNFVPAAACAELLQRQFAILI
jgi:hypothetical protein